MGSSSVGKIPGGHDAGCPEKGRIESAEDCPRCNPSAAKPIDDETLKFYAEHDCKRFSCHDVPEHIERRDLARALLAVTRERDEWKRRHEIRSQAWADAVRERDVALKKLAALTEFDKVAASVRYRLPERVAKLEAAAAGAIITLDTSMVRWNIAKQMAYREDCRAARDRLIDALRKTDG